MTSLDFLIIVAGVQAGFLIALVVLIVLTRWFWIRRRARMEGPRDGLRRAVQAWLGGAPVGAVMAQLRRLPAGMALDMLLHYAERLKPEAVSRLATAVANQPWARAIIARGRSRHWWHRLEAGRLLTVAGQPRDAPLLLRLLADPHAAVVLAAIGALERVQSTALFAAVLEQLPRLAHTVQAYAAATLERARTSLTPVLAKYLSGPTNRQGLAAYVDLASRLTAPELRAPLTALATHGDMEARAAVARALGRYPHDDSIAALSELAADRAWQVRALAIQSLARLQAATVPIFHQGLRDGSWWVRLRAALALIAGGPEGRNALLSAEVGADAFARDMARLVLGLPEAALAEYQR